jgi:hypothetical protein
MKPRIQSDIGEHQSQPMVDDGAQSPEEGYQGLHHDAARFENGSKREIDASFVDEVLSPGFQYTRMP